MVRRQPKSSRTANLAFPVPRPKAPPAASFSVAGLFAGIGGVELGLNKAGHRTELLCEFDPWARAVLSHHFGSAVNQVPPDVRDLDHIPGVDLLTAGFPCQDLSQAGRTRGIGGERSGLVGEVFRLLRDSEPSWVLLENVPFMLSLDRGHAMSTLVDEFEGLGFRWAYRIVDTRAFGLPQRRRRVLFLASRDLDPRQVLLSDDAGPPPSTGADESSSFGFYWTEGTRGLGWAEDAVPTLKGGSSIGIPSPPAIWLANGDIVTPHIDDAERLQGFPRGWTKPALDVPNARAGTRWKLVGNAVSVPVSKWVGQRLAAPKPYEDTLDTSLSGYRWPTAAWGDGSGRFVADVSEWPKRYKQVPISDFLKAQPKLLSERATRGFYKRALTGRLRFRAGFLEAVKSHAERMEQMR